MVATELAFTPVAEQAELVRSGELSSRELVDAYLDRIERLEPRLNSFRVVFADRAREEADRVGPGDERPLAGVPVAVKDNLDVAGEVTAMGSRAFGAPAREDAEIVRRLRAAGAIVIGKTHMSELAIHPWTETVAWGTTLNPWDPDASVGGSSGGSGAAVAAGLVGAATASDGGGSIRIPAACNGLFGLKPQRGRVPLAPLEEHWHGLTAAGILTRGVLDTALLLDSLATRRPRSRPYASAARSTPGPLRVAVSTKPSALRADVDPSVEAAVWEVAELLRSRGHRVDGRDPDYPNMGRLYAARWFRGIHDDARAMAHPERLERRTRGMARVGGAFPMAAVASSRRAEAAAADRINEVLADNDVLLTPTLPGPPHRAGAYEGRGWLGATIGASQIVAYTLPWNVTGQPAASLPAPSTGPGGVPLAVQLIGRPDDEATVLSVAAQLEAEIGWTRRRPPVDQAGSGAPSSAVS